MNDRLKELNLEKEELWRRMKRLDKMISEEITEDWVILARHGDIMKGIRTLRDKYSLSLMTAKCIVEDVRRAL